MPMSQGRSEISMVSTPQARVEWTTSGPQDLYLLYDQAEYLQSSTPDGWWQRTLALDPYHWFRLSGAADTSSWEAICGILREPSRPAFTLPELVVALFLAQTDQPNTLTHRQLFRWVISALPSVRACLPPGSLEAGWEEVSGDTLEQCLPIIINVLLQHEPQVLWVLPDGVWLQVLAYLGDRLWRFPPNLTRAIGYAAATCRDGQGATDTESEGLDGHPSSFDASTAIGYLSAMRFWRYPWPTIRGLPIQTGALDFLPLWHQVLIIMDPDAPAISDMQFAWLCDGTVGAPSDGPFDCLTITGYERDAVAGSVTSWQERIVALRQEAARGTCRPYGCWEVVCDADWPVFSTYNVATMRVVAGPQGCWVRLVPAHVSWGSVLWWQPRRRPLMYLGLALQEALTSIPVLAFHATFWQLWRDLRCEGRPTGEALRIT
jgi:hypothetical protein